MILFKEKVKRWDEYLSNRHEEISNLGERMNEQLIFLGISKETLSYVKEASVILVPYKAEMINTFYEAVTSIPSLRQMINDHSSLDRLKKTMSRYLEQFFQAELDDDYVRSRMTVGHVHSRIHLSAEHFISAHHLLVQTMTAILVEKLHQRPDTLMRTMLAVQKLAAFDQQLIVEVYMEESTLKSFLFDVSDLLNDVTQLQTTEQLTNCMSKMVNESSVVTTATDEISQSIDKVASSSSSMAEKMALAMESTGQSQQVIETALRDIQQVGAVYKEVVARVERLNNEIEQIESVIKMIEKITMQTNLLALNAGIEAARAGEYGRGFTIVAQEVRKLATNTKEQTLSIAEKVESLQVVSQLLTKDMEKTAELVKQCVNGANTASEELSFIISTMSEADGSTSQIAAMAEEQTSAIREIASRNLTMHELGARSKEVAKQTAGTIYELSKQMDRYREAFLNTNIRLHKSDYLKIMKTDHLLLKWKVFNILMGLEKDNLAQYIEKEQCRFCGWHHLIMDESTAKQEGSFSQLVKRHQAVHDFAKQAVDNYIQGNDNEAFSQFEKLEAEMNNVLTLLEQIEADYKFFLNSES